MFAAQFEYHRAQSIAEAIDLLQRYGDDGKLLAGGHSLLPLMKLRFAQPGHLIDIRRIGELSGIGEKEGRITIGAGTTHSALHQSDVIKLRLPMLSDAAGHIGDPLVRNMGTIGGSLAHADPAADLPAVVLAYEGEILVAGPGGQRTIAAADFFTGMFQTALQPSEVITDIRFAVPAAGTGAAYVKHAHPASGYAVVGVAAVLTAGSGNKITQARVAVTGVGAVAARARATEQMVAGQNFTADLVQLAAGKVADGIEVRGDLYAPKEYRAQLARVCAERALVAAIQRRAETTRA